MKNIRKAGFFNWKTNPHLFHLDFTLQQLLMLIEKIHTSKGRSYKMLNNSGLFQFIGDRIYFSLKYK